MAVPPEEAIERAKARLKERFEESIQRLDNLKNSEVMDELKQLFNKGLQLVSPEELTGALKGKYSMLQQIETMIKSANEKINIITTPEGLMDLYNNHLELLKKASEKGVKIRIATQPDEKVMDAIRALSGIAEVRLLKEVPVSGRVVVVDGKQFIFGLTEGVHTTQHIAVWSHSPYAASNLFEPMFELLWDHAVPLGDVISSSKAQ